MAPVMAAGLNPLNVPTLLLLLHRIVHRSKPDKVFVCGTEVFRAK
jgi:hypothetical protein